ncbi:BnaC03g64310D [Brassica napus]|uniref:BnaC03g64310D protein n=1 Tax=Brassica napus TaxID=3708 RepID=A0A078ICQ3_BRANA|nr:BnaC03g64310D [Brassica napus]
MCGSPDIAMRCGEAAGVGLHRESSTVQPLKDKGRQMLILDNVAVRYGRTAGIGLHAESSTVPPLKLNGSAKNRENRGS